MTKYITIPYNTNTFIEDITSIISKYTSYKHISVHRTFGLGHDSIHIGLTMV